MGGSTTKCKYKGQKLVTWSHGYPLACLFANRPSIFCMSYNLKLTFLKSHFRYSVRKAFERNMLSKPGSIEIKINFAII